MSDDRIKEIQEELLAEGKTVTGRTPPPFTWPKGKEVKFRLIPHQEKILDELRKMGDTHHMELAYHEDTDHTNPFAALERRILPHEEANAEFRTSAADKERQAKAEAKRQRKAAKLRRLYGA